MPIILLSTCDNNRLSTVFNGVALLQSPKWMASSRQMAAHFLRQICVYCTAVSCAVAAAAGSRNASPLAGNTRRGGRTMTQEVEDIRRVSLNLGVPAFEELSQLAQERKSTLAQILRLALGLGKVAITEFRKGNRLLVVSGDGTALKELVLPQL
jgi:hypothetical protein